MEFKKRFCSVRRVENTAGQYSENTYISIIKTFTHLHLNNDLCRSKYNSSEANPCLYMLWSWKIRLWPVFNALPLMMMTMTIIISHTPVNTHVQLRQAHKPRDKAFFHIIYYHQPKISIVKCLYGQDTALQVVVSDDRRRQRWGADAKWFTGWQFTSSCRHVLVTPCFQQTTLFFSCLLLYLNGLWTFTGINKSITTPGSGDRHKLGLWCLLWIW